MIENFPIILSVATKETNALKMALPDATEIFKLFLLQRYLLVFLGEIVLL